MTTYTVADSPESLRQNRGVEVMASGWEEARDKAEALGVPFVEGVGKYAVTDGIETREMDCGRVPLLVIEIEEEELL